MEQQSHLKILFRFTFSLLKIFNPFFCSSFYSNYGGMAETQLIVFATATVQLTSQILANLTYHCEQIAISDSNSNTV